MLIKPLSCLNPKRFSAVAYLLAISVFICKMALGANAAFAQDDSEAKRFEDQAELSVVSTSGNSEVLTFSLKNILAYDFSQQYRGSWKVSMLSGEQDGEKNAERYSTNLRLDSLFPSRIYAYLLGSWLRDKFAGYDHRYSLGPGIGQRLVDGPNHFLKAEIGCNWTREDYIDAETESFLEGRAYGEYEYVIVENSKFLQTVEYLHDFNDHANFKLITETAVTSALTEIVAIKIAYEVRFQNRPAQDRFQDTDTVFSGAVVVSF